MTAPTRRFRAPLARSAAALLALLALGCHDSPSEPSGEVSFQVVTKTRLSPAGGPQLREVVRDQARWAEVWRQLWADGEEPALPAIDFSREMAIVATASISCFGEVAIEGVERAGGRLTVRIADATPGTFCLCFAPEYVFEVVRASRVDGPAEFQVRPIPPRCPG